MEVLMKMVDDRELPLARQPGGEPQGWNSLPARGTSFLAPPGGGSLREVCPASPSVDTLTKGVEICRKEHDHLRLW